MDRDDLLSLLTAMHEDNVAVKPDGKVCKLDTGDECELAELESAVAELTAELAKLVAWAKLAPNYEPPGDPTNTGGLVDSEGIPY